MSRISLQMSENLVCQLFGRDNLHLNNGWLLFVWEADAKIHAWDSEKGELLWKVDIPWNCVEDLRISGDGFRIFTLFAPHIWAWSVQTGENTDKVKIEYLGVSGSLIIDESKIWAYWPESNYQGWDFGILNSTPIQLSGLPKIFSSGAVWSLEHTKIKNIATGDVIFQLSGRFLNVTSVQCNGFYLVAGYESGEILILDLTHVL